MGNGYTRTSTFNTPLQAPPRLTARVNPTISDLPSSDLPSTPRDAQHRNGYSRVDPCGQPDRAVGSSWSGGRNS